MSNIVEKVSLNFTDLTGDQTGCIKLGSNKFWTGWVEDLGGSANFECRWGPTGTAGSDKGSKRGISLNAALDLLSKKVKAKKKKGYTQLETRSVQEEVVKAAAKGVDLTNGKAKPSPVVTPAHTIHREVERLLGVIYNETSKAVRSGLSAQAGATEDNPIGNLSDAQLDHGGQILDDIQDLLDSRFGGDTHSNQSKTLPLTNGVPSRDIIHLTNRYMSNVPREIGRGKRGATNLHKVVVSSYERLEAERKFLQLLRDAHLAQATFQAAAAAGTTQHNKAAVWYDGLGCDIEYLDPSNPEYRRVKNIFEKGQSRKNANFYGSGVKLVRVWKLTRQGSEPLYDRYKSDTLRKQGALGEIFAWHGTRDENLLGISRSGLLLPENLPRGVRLSGKAFGRGIYHAPAWTATNIRSVGSKPTDGTNGALKSLNYTSLRGAFYGAGNTAPRAFMFLQNVALGVPEVHTRSCWDKRRPDRFPQVDFIYANAGGCSSLTHDEIVTFNQDAQVFRYLCEFSR